MFNILVSASLRNRVFVLMAALLLVAYGSFIVPRIPIDVFPDLNRPSVTLMTEAAGVAQVIPIGGEVRQFRVVPQPALMQALDVTYEQIEAAAARFGTNTAGGFVDQQGREYLIRNVGVTKRLEDLRDTVIAYRQGQ